MHTRFLVVLAVSAFILTLLFAVAAGAQDETTDVAATLGGGGGIQVQQSQQQQVGTQQVTVQAGICRDPRVEETVEDRERDEGSFDVEGGAIEIRYDVREAGADDELFVEVRDEDDDLVRRFRVEGTTSGEQVLRTRVDPGTFTFEVDADEGVEDYIVELVDCRNTEPQDNNNGGGGGDGGDGDGSDGTTDDGTTDDGTTNNGVTTSQTDDTTTDDTTTADTTTDDATTAADLTAQDAGDSANREGSFRCESFLHVIRDDDGALRWQYRDGRGDDELVVQRFEQCLEADVLANTVPDRLLPDTGGPLLPLAGGALLLLAAGRITARLFMP